MRERRRKGRQGREGGGESERAEGEKLKERIICGYMYSGMFVLFQL